MELAQHRVLAQYAAVAALPATTTGGASKADDEGEEPGPESAGDANPPGFGLPPHDTKH